MLLMQAADDFVSPLILALLDVDAGEGFGEYTAVFLFAILAGIGLKFGSKFWFVIFVLLDFRQFETSWRFYKNNRSQKKYKYKRNGGSQIGRASCRERVCLYV